MTAYLPNGCHLIFIFTLNCILLVVNDYIHPPYDPLSTPYHSPTYHLPLTTPHPPTPSYHNQPSTTPHYHPPTHHHPPLHPTTTPLPPTNHTLPPSHPPPPHPTPRGKVVHKYRIFHALSHIVYPFGRQLSFTSFYYISYPFLPVKK